MMQQGNKHPFLIQGQPLEEGHKSVVKEHSKVMETLLLCMYYTKRHNEFLHFHLRGFEISLCCCIEDKCCIAEHNECMYSIMQYISCVTMFRGEQKYTELFSEWQPLSEVESFRVSTPLLLRASTANQHYICVGVSNTSQQMKHLIYLQLKAWSSRVMFL